MHMKRGLTWWNAASTTLESSRPGKTVISLGVESSIQSYKYVHYPKDSTAERLTCMADAMAGGVSPQAPSVPSAYMVLGRIHELTTYVTLL